MSDKKESKIYSNQCNYLQTEIFHIFSEIFFGAQNNAFVWFVEHCRFRFRILFKQNIQYIWKLQLKSNLFPSRKRNTLNKWMADLKWKKKKNWILWINFTMENSSLSLSFFGTFFVNFADWLICVRPLQTVNQIWRFVRIGFWTDTIPRRFNCLFLAT